MKKGFGLLLGLLLAGNCLAAANPNIVVILTDDQGYGDISFNPHHPVEISTPNMDSLATEGVFFSQAYISGNVCSPTRAGLMLGRYQQRVGVYGAGEGGQGFDLSNHIFPYFLPDEYVSGAFGKWHLGTELQGWGPCDRGFDETYNFLGRGSHDYYDLANPDSPIYRCETPYPDIGYLTNRLTEEAVDFIDNHKSEPFFLYLAYNAVHAPAQAPQEDIDYYSSLYPELTETRKILLAMLKHLDLGVGQVVQKLKDEGLWDNTLLFFLTDNGGAGAMDADCSPLRGNKGTNWEGGIRTPFVVSWPDEFSGGRIIDTPIISLDILPTVFDALDMDEPGDKPFDGKSLIPLLRGETTEHHEALYWGEGGEDGGWAIRHGDWKVIGFCEEMKLYNLDTDPYETTDVADQNPMKVVELAMMHDAWIDQMGEPMKDEVKKCEAYDALCQAFNDPYDYDNNCLVELTDLVTFLEPWLLTGGNDLVDFGYFSRHWLNSGLVGMPVADAGDDQTVDDADANGSESITLDGSGSYDLDGTIESYVWKEYGSQIATGVSPTITLASGIHLITLEVTDDDVKAATDGVLVTVGTGQLDPIQHLDATVSGSVTGSPVTRWADQSSNGNDAVNGVGNVYYPGTSLSASGLAGLDFGYDYNNLELFDETGQDIWLDQSTGRGFCVLVAFKCDALTNSRIDVIGNTGSSTSSGFGLRYTSGGDLRGYLGGISFSMGGTPVAVGDTIVYAFNYDASTGVYEVWDSKNNNSITESVTAADFSLSSSVTLGSTTNDGRYFEGMVGEVKVYDGVLSAAQFQSETDALVAKWVVE